MLLLGDNYLVYSLSSSLGSFCLSLMFARDFVTCDDLDDGHKMRFPLQESISLAGGHFMVTYYLYLSTKARVLMGNPL